MVEKLGNTIWNWLSYYIPPLTSQATAVPTLDENFVDVTPTSAVSRAQSLTILERRDLYQQLVWAQKNKKEREIAAIYSKLGVTSKLDQTGKMHSLIQHWSKPMDQASWLEEIQECLKHGADPNLCDSQGQLPLHQALAAGYRDVAERLLHFQADTLLADVEGNTAFFYVWSSSKEDLKTAISLCDKLLQLTLLPAQEIFAKKNFYDQTPLHYIVQSDPPELFIEYLVEKGANPEARDAAGHTPLFLCVKCGAQRSMEGLLMADANIEALDNEQNTPLAFAFAQSQLTMAKLLMEEGALVTKKALENAYECVQLDQNLVDDLLGRGDFSETEMSKEEFKTKFCRAIL